jgi:hypothetical protein
MSAYTEAGNRARLLRRGLPPWGEAIMRCSAQPDPYTYGNLSPRVAAIRANYMNNFDLSLFKEFHPVERITMQFRAEALNAFNRVQFAAPNTTVTSSAFGHVTAAANTPRQVCNSASS